MLRSISGALVAACGGIGEAGRGAAGKVGAWAGGATAKGGAVLAQSRLAGAAILATPGRQNMNDHAADGSAASPARFQPLPPPPARKRSSSTSSGRRIDTHQRRLLGAVLAAGHAHAQHGGAAVGHDGLPWGGHGQRERRGLGAGAAAHGRARVACAAKRAARTKEERGPGGLRARGGSRRTKNTEVGREARNARPGKTGRARQAGQNKTIAARPPTLTSAKSTLTRPGMVMMSEMPCTPCSSTARQAEAGGEAAPMPAREPGRRGREARGGTGRGRPRAPLPRTQCTPPVAACIAGRTNKSTACVHSPGAPGEAHRRPAGRRPAAAWTRPPAGERAASSQRCSRQALRRLTQPAGCEAACVKQCTAACRPAPHSGQSHAPRPAGGRWGSQSACRRSCAASRCRRWPAQAGTQSSSRGSTGVGACRRGFKYPLARRGEASGDAAPLGAPLCNDQAPSPKSNQQAPASLGRAPHLQRAAAALKGEWVRHHPHSKDAHVL